jgi:hypothetical protein
MKKIKLALLTTLVPGLAAQAANIAWISFHSDAGGAPSANALAAGFTQAPDIGYTSLLTGAGHTVTRIQSIDDANLSATFSAINTYDLVIIGRSVASGHYQQANEATFWNTTVTAPLMDMSGYTLRNSRLGYTTGGTIPDTTGPITLTVAETSHPIFAGISLGAGNITVNPYADVATFMATLQRGISVNTDPLAGGGKLLASVSAGADPAAGGTIIAEWNAGATMGTSPATTLGGHRLAFVSGSREADGVTSESAGIMDLSADGKTMFLNAVNYMTTPVPEPATAGLLAVGAVALLLRKRRA